MWKSEIREPKSERTPKSENRNRKLSEFGLRPSFEFRHSGFDFACCSCSSRFKNKNPTAVWQWGSINFLTQSEPDRRAAQPQRVGKQQVQIHIHDSNLAIIPPGVNPFFRLVFSRPAKVLACIRGQETEITGGVLAFIGYRLSSRVRWHDSFVNIPFALAFDWMVGLFSNLRLCPMVLLLDLA